MTMPHTPLRAAVVVLAATVAIGALLVAASTLTGRSGNHRAEDLQARVDSTAKTVACRTYLLSVAGADQQALRLLKRAKREGGWENDPINEALDKMRTATRDAGTTRGLTDTDFAPFLTLANAVGNAYTDANPTGGGEGITTDTIDTLTDALTTVRDTCDTGNEPA